MVCKSHFSHQNIHIVMITVFFISRIVIQNVVGLFSNFNRGVNVLEMMIRESLLKFRLLKL